MPRLRVLDPNSDEGPRCQQHLPRQQRFLRQRRGVRLRDTVQAPRGDQRPKALEPLPPPFQNAQRSSFSGWRIDERYTPRLRQLPRRRWEGDLFPDQAPRRAGLLNSHLPRDNTPQAFGRGLAILGEGLIAGGSSPATVSVYDTSEVVRTINLTMDVRNTIHSLEVWPF
jgi:hypothetical protein